MSHRRSYFFAAVLLLVLGGCGDDSTSPTPETTNTVAGVVVRFDDGQPLLDTTVVLTTADFVVLRSAKVDQDGAFSFGEVPAGSLLLYAIHDNYEMAEPSASRVHLQGGKTWTVTVSMLEFGDPNLQYHITGRVTDANTGDPLPGAWISNGGLGEAGNSVRYLMNNSGITIGVSDAEGYYSLPMWGVPENGDGPVIGLGPISCGRDGYRSRTFAGEGPDFSHDPTSPGGLLPAPADSVLVIDIAMEPIPAGGLPSGDTGTVRGIIVHGDQPQAGVLVTMTLMVLADRDTVFDPVDKVSVHGGSVRSAADGSFEFKLQPGFYGLRAGLLPDDGWAFDGGLPSLEVVVGEVVEVGNISVNPAVFPVYPVAASTVTSDSVNLNWTSIPGATSYRIIASIDSFRMSTIAVTSETRMAWPFDMPAPGESYLVRWKVFARKEIEPGYIQTFSQFEVPASFTLMNEGTP
jgi:hypothetical protein